MGTIINILFLLAVFSIIRRLMKQSGQGDPFEKIFNQFRQGAAQVRGTGRNNQSVNYDNIKNAMVGDIFGKMKNSVVGIVVVIIAVIVLINMIVIIPAGHTGVRTLFGKVKDNELPSGLHLINPLETIERMSIRTEEYTMSIAQGEGQRQGADQITALTNEGLPVDLDITVFYHLVESEAAGVYKDLGLAYQEKIIRPEIRSAIREVVAQYDAKAIYSEKRGAVAEGITELLIKTVEPRGILVEQVLLRNVTLPPNLSASIQEKLKAEQDSQRYDFVLEKEKKEADRRRIEAEGQRDAQKTINESLTPAYLEYLYINGLKEREGTIYVPTDPTNGLPMFRGIQ